MEHRPWSLDALLQLLMGIFVCLSLGVILAHVLVPEDLAATDEGRFVALLVNLTVLQLGVLICVRVFLRAGQMTWREAFGLDRNRGASVGLALLVVLPVTPLVMLLQHLSARLMTTVQVRPQTQEVVQTLERTVGWDERLFFGLMAIVLAPLVEEILFRGILYRAIRERGRPRLALWGTSLLFAFTHANVMTFLPLTFLALVLAWLYERTGNLLASIAGHATFNAINFFLVVFQRDLTDFLRAWHE